MGDGGREGLIGGGEEEAVSAYGGNGGGAAWQHMRGRACISSSGSVTTRVTPYSSAAAWRKAIITASWRDVSWQIIIKKNIRRLQQREKTA